MNPHIMALGCQSLEKTGALYLADSRQRSMGQLKRRPGPMSLQRVAEGHQCLSDVVGRCPIQAGQRGVESGPLHPQSMDMDRVEELELRGRSPKPRRPHAPNHQRDGPQDPKQLPVHAFTDV